MQQTNQEGVLIALLERLEQEWPWIERLYIIQGSPLRPQQYQSITPNIRQSALLKNVALESTVQKKPEYENVAAVWIESIQPRSERRTDLSVWIILLPPRGGLRLFRRGVVTVNVDKDKVFAEPLSRLETSFTRALIPPSGKRLACSPLFEYNSSWSWWDERMIWYFATDLTAAPNDPLARRRYVESRLNRGQVSEVRSVRLKSNGANEIQVGAIQLSPQGRYLSWSELKDEQQWRLIQSVKGDNFFTRVILPPEQVLYRYTWIDDTHWVEYRQEEQDFIVDVYEVQHTAKIRSHGFPNPISEDELNHIGLSAQGELALVKSFSPSQDGKVTIYFVDLKRQALRTTVVPVPESQYVQSLELSPNGKWLVWSTTAGKVNDWFFVRGAIWVSRVDGSAARKITDYSTPRLGWTADTHHYFKWRRDSAALADTWGDCLYSFPV